MADKFLLFDKNLQSRDRTVYYFYGGDNYSIVTISKTAYDGIVTRVCSEKDNTIISD